MEGFKIRGAWGTGIEIYLIEQVSLLNEKIWVFDDCLSDPLLLLGSVGPVYSMH